jgi:hypothetical protein
MSSPVYKRSVLAPQKIISLDFVIPNEVKDLHFAANFRSLAPLGMTILKGIFNKH